MRKFRSWLWPAMLICAPTMALPQSYQDRVAAEGAAGAVVAYEQVAEECFSEPVINAAFKAIDRDYQASFPRFWQGMKDRADTNNRIILQSGLAGPEGRIIDAENACKVAARLMTFGIAYIGMRYFMAYPGLEKALKQHADNDAGSFLGRVPPPSMGGIPVEDMLKNVDKFGNFGSGNARK